MNKEKNPASSEFNHTNCHLSATNENSTSRELLMSFKDDAQQKTVVLTIEIPTSEDTTNKKTILLNFQFGDTKFHMDLPPNYKLKDLFNFIKQNEHVFTQHDVDSTCERKKGECPKRHQNDCCKSHKTALLNCNSSLRELIIESSKIDTIVVANEWGLYCGVFTTKNEVIKDFQCYIDRAYLDEALMTISPIIENSTKIAQSNTAVKEDKKPTPSNPLELQTYQEIQEKLLSLSKKINSTDKELDETEILFIRESCVFLRKVEEMRYA